MKRCNRNLAALKIKTVVMFTAKWCFLVITMAMLSVLSMPAGTALANQSQPDSVPAPLEIDVYRNMLETGDQLYIFYINIPYAVVPDALVTEAFIWRLIDTDNITELGQTTGSVFQDNGYGYNVYSMYFAAADAPTWGADYTVRLSENPSVFDAPIDFNYGISSGDYSILTETEDVQAEIAARVIGLAKQLDTRWSLAPADSLIKEQETGTVLSLNGETVFRAAIFGLQALAPTAFDIVVGLITATDRTWTDNYTSNVVTQYTGTWIGTAQNAGASMFNKSYDLLSVILVLIAVAGILIGNMFITKSAYSGMIDAAFVAVIFGRLGFYELSFLALIAGVCWLYFSGKVWGVIR